MPPLRALLGAACERVRALQRCHHRAGSSQAASREALSDRLAAALTGAQTWGILTLDVEIANDPTTKNPTRGTPCRGAGGSSRPPGASSTSTAARQGPRGPLVTSDSHLSPPRALPAAAESQAAAARVGAAEAVESGL